MKKIVTTLFMGMAATSMAFGFDFVPFDNSLPMPRKDLSVQPYRELQGNTRATENDLPNNMWGYDCGVYSWSHLGETVTNLRVAAEYDENLVKVLDGKTINKLAVVAPALMASKSVDMSLFITYDLNAEPVAEIEFTSEGCPVNSQGKITAIKYEVVDLDEPITIEAGKPFYVGFSVAKAVVGQRTADYVIPIDGIPSNINGNLFSAEETKGEWFNGTPDMGCACVYVGLDELPTDIIRVVTSSTPAQIDLNTTLVGNHAFINLGSNTVSSVSTRVQINTQEPVSVEATKDNGKLLKNGNNGPVEGVVGAGEIGYAIFDVPVTIVGAGMPVYVDVDKVNGNANEWFNQMMTYILVMPDGEGYDRTVVVEEGTGTWCGWCVRGYVGMEYMAEKYNDGSYIGIAVHSGDKMETKTYGDMIARYFTGFPSAVVNRMTSIDPSKENLEKAYLESKSRLTYGKLDLRLNSIGDDTATVTTDAEFIFPTDCLLAYVVKEDGVGPYGQSNYYAGGQSGPMDGFESKGQSVSLIFNEVARNIFDAFGMPGSLPEKIDAYTKYTHEAEISLAKVKDIEKATIVAMIINKNDGTIANAAQVKLGGSGVESVSEAARNAVSVSEGTIASTENAVVYSIDGRQVAEIAAGSSVNVAAGIYVVRVADNTVKVMVK